MVATNSRQLVLIGTLGQLPVQFSFDSTSFTFRDSSKSTCASFSTTFVSLLNSAASPDVHVPLSHVLSVDVSGSVVDAHVLVRNRGHLDVVNISGNFQEDDSEASSAAKDWVQGVMTAAYSGA
jgi:hypothetical protein